MKKQLREICITAGEILPGDLVETLCGKIVSMKQTRVTANGATCDRCLIAYHNEDLQPESEPVPAWAADPVQVEKRNTEKKRRPGRPKLEHGRTVYKPVRWTEEQWAEVDQAAQVAGMTPSALIRAAVLSQVRAMLATKPGAALAAARKKRKGV